MKLPETNFDLMKGTKIHDKNNQKIGVLYDLLITFSNEMTITKIILETTTTDGILAKLKLNKGDKIPIPVEFVTQFELDKIQLQLSKEFIEESAKEIVPIQSGEYFFTELKSKSVIDVEENNLGTVKNLLVNDNKSLLLIGDNFFEELLEDLGLLPDTDIILNINEIHSIDDDFTRLNKSKDELKRIVKSSDQLQGDNPPPTFHFPIRMYPPY